MMKRILPASTAVAALAALTAGGAAANCERLAGEVRSAIAAAATTHYDDLYAAVATDPTCDAKYRGQVGRTMARSLLTTLAVDSDPAAIAKALRFGRPWQVLVALGDAYYDRQDFANAGDAYEEALTDMADTAANPTPPQEKVVERVEQRALQSGSLLPAADMFASRGLATAPRHAEPRVIAFFAAGSAELGDVGRTGVKAAFATIQKTAPKSVIIIGHADAGEDAGLAEARARTVAAYLDELGYAGRIETVGRGSDEPFPVDEPDKLPPEQKQKLERRAEYAPGD